MKSIRKKEKNCFFIEFLLSKNSTLIDKFLFVRVLKFSLLDPFPTIWHSFLKSFLTQVNNFSVLPRKCLSRRQSLSMACLINTVQDTVQLNNLYIREGAEKSSATPRNSEKKTWYLAVWTNFGLESGWSWKYFRIILAKFYWSWLD